MRARRSSSNSRRASTGSRPSSRTGKVTLAPHRRRAGRSSRSRRGRARSAPARTTCGSPTSIAGCGCGWTASSIDFGTDGDYTPPTPEQEAAFKDPKGNPDMNPEGWTRANDVDRPGEHRRSGRRRRAEHQAPSRRLLHAAEPGPTTTPRPTSSTSSPATTCAWATTAPRAPTAASGAWSRSG